MIVNKSSIIHWDDCFSDVSHLDIPQIIIIIYFTEMLFRWCSSPACLDLPHLSCIYVLLNTCFFLCCTVDGVSTRQTPFQWQFKIIVYLSWSINILHLSDSDHILQMYWSLNIIEDHWSLNNGFPYCDGCRGCIWKSSILRISKKMFQTLSSISCLFNYLIIPKS